MEDGVADGAGLGALELALHVALHEQKKREVEARQQREGDDAK